MKEEIRPRKDRFRVKWEDGPNRELQGLWFNSIARARRVTDGKNIHGVYSECN